MATEVLVAIIGALALVIAALVSVVVPLLISTRRAAKQTNYQVTNDHSTNLRVEQDERHHDNATRIGKLETLARSTASSVKRIERHLGIEPTPRGAKK